MRLSVMSELVTFFLCCNIYLLEQVGELVLGVVGYGVGADVYFGSSS